MSSLYSSNWKFARLTYVLISQLITALEVVHWKHKCTKLFRKKADDSLNKV